MKTFIQKLIREYFDDDYDISIFDKPKNIKSNKIDNFKNVIKDLGAVKTKGKINTYTLELGDSQIHFKKTNKPNTIELDLVYTNIESRGSGSARRIMNKFLEVIDKYKIKVELYIVPRDKTTNPNTLEKFYRDFGFIKISDFEMIRN
jgi:predicted GNAT family acetyltransferase